MLRPLLYTRRYAAASRGPRLTISRWSGARRFSLRWWTTGERSSLTILRLERQAARTTASRTSFCTDAYVKAGINARSSATVTRIRDARAADARRSSTSTSRAARDTDDSQLPASMRAEVKARGDRGGSYWAGPGWAPAPCNSARGLACRSQETTKTQHRTCK